MKKTIMTKNIYMPNDNRIVAEGEIRGRRWWVVAYHGHPNAYVEILDDDEKFKNFTNDDLESLPIQVHGGITFAGKIKTLPTDRVIGWDYAHLGDYVAGSMIFIATETIWPIEDIIDHCIHVCGQVEALSI